MSKTNILSDTTYSTGFLLLRIYFQFYMQLKCLTLDSVDRNYTEISETNDLINTASEPVSHHKKACLTFPWYIKSVKVPWDNWGGSPATSLGDQNICEFCHKST